MYGMCGHAYWPLPMPCATLRLPPSPCPPSSARQPTAQKCPGAEASSIQGLGSCLHFPSHALRAGVLLALPYTCIHARARPIFSSVLIAAHIAVLPSSPIAFLPPSRSCQFQAWGGCPAGCAWKLKILAKSGLSWAEATSGKQPLTEQLH